MSRLWFHGLWNSNFQYWSLRCERNNGFLCMVRDDSQFKKLLWFISLNYGSLVGSRGLNWSQLWWKNRQKQMTSFLGNICYPLIGLYGLCHFDSFEFVCGKLDRAVYVTGGVCSFEVHNFHYTSYFCGIWTLDWKIHGVEMMIKSRQQKYVICGLSMANRNSLDKWCLWLILMPPDLEYLTRSYLFSITGIGNTNFDHYCIR